MITDLLFGVVSITDNSKHFFFADLDTDDYSEILLKSILLLNHMDYLIIVKSGKGYHLLNFQKKFTLEEYIFLLELIGADENYIKWVKKVGYGVLRISRRSSHFKVPEIDSIVKKQGYEFTENDNKYIFFYLSLIGLEKDIKDVMRVEINDRKSGD